MDIKRSAMIILNEEDLSKIIADYLSKEGFEVTGCKFKVSSHIEGYGYGEHEVLTFAGCEVTCSFRTSRDE